MTTPYLASLAWSGLLLASFAVADEPASQPASPPTESTAAAPTPAKNAPAPIVGVTASLGHTLQRGKPSAYAIGVQGIFAAGPWRFAVEAFFASPVTAFTPAVGGDLGLGLVDKRGIGGALGLYGRHVLAGPETVPSTQLGPGLMLLAKVAPTVVLATPLVLWVDVETSSLTPTLSVKLVLGVPWAR
jgi:hypothetical protein